MALNAEGNAAVELHDSELLRVTRNDSECVLELDGYVHRSPATPGVSPGTGWSQKILVRLSGVHVLQGVSALPLSLSDGTLRAEGVAMRNLVPVPSSFTGPVHLELLGFDAERVTVRAESVELSFAGQAVFVEEFPG